jgi:hypothetical protein
MIVRVKPRLDPKLKKLFDRLLKTEDKTLPLHFKFLKNMTPELRDQFMEYFSYTTKYDLKEYELVKRRFKNNEKLLIDNMLDIVTDFKDSEVWKTDHLKQVRGIYLGSMYQIKYRNYQHDPFPLALFLNTYDGTHQNFQAINLHYFVPQFRKYFIDKILTMNKPRIVAEKPPILTMEMVNKLVPSLGMAYRSYKAEEIKVIEKINHSRWKTYLEIDNRNIRLKK